jgi:Fe-S-cluster containining protein
MFYSIFYNIIMVSDELKQDFLSARFRFRCDKSCNSKCCRESFLQLDPYDILSMRKRLGISSQEFLEKYTYYDIDNNSPVLAFLKMPCPFLRSEGCSIYEERPIKCRLYPIVEYCFKKSSDEAVTYDIYYLLDKTNCIGLQGNAEWTVETWKKIHGIDILDELHKEWFEILFLANISGECDQAQIRIAGYDLDRFRRFILNTRFLDIVYIADEEIHKINVDDIALMKFGFRYLKHIFNIERTLKIKENNELQFDQIIKDIMQIK